MNASPRMLVFTLLTGCTALGGGEPGSGTSKTETRQVAAFTQVSLAGSLHADITAGAPQIVELTGDDNLLPLVGTDVTDGELRVKPTKRIRPKLDLAARIAAPTLTSVSSSGSNEIKIHGVSGDAFKIDGSGSMQLSAGGTAQKLAISVSGSAKLDTSELQAQDVSIHASGSADLVVYASGVLDVHCSGSAHIRYAGNPREVKKDVSGSATIEPR